MVDFVKGKVAVQEMQAQLRDAINAKLSSLTGKGKLDNIAIQNKYDISKIDLYNIISGKGTVPLARMVMFAANLGLDILLVVSESSVDEFDPE